MNKFKKLVISVLDIIGSILLIELVIALIYAFCWGLYCFSEWRNFFDIPHLSIWPVGIKIGLYLLIFLAPIYALIQYKLSQRS